MLKQQQGYVLSIIGPHTYLLPYGQSIADQKHGIIINETGEFLWKMLETPQSMDTLITALAGHYQMDSSEISELSEDVVQFIRQLISLGIVQDLSKAAGDSHPMILSIAGLHICLTGMPALYPDQLSAFCVSDLSVNSGTFTTHIPADMTIELLHQTPPFHQNGTLLLRSKELIVLETCDGYVLLFPSLAGISDVYLSNDGTYARIYCTGNADCNTREQIFHVIRHLFLYRAQTTDKFALHSASILYKGKAWLFSGHSGMGKSTHTALWHKYFQTPYLNGDLNLIGFEQDSPIIYGIPWCGTSGLYTTENIPLGGIVLLGRGKTDHLVQLKPHEKTLKFMQRLISPAWDTKLLKKNLDFATQLTASVPVFQLFCTKEPSAAATIKERIDQLT